MDGSFALYDITLYGSDDATVQPNGTVKVSIPVPEGTNEDLIALYRINEDGTKTLIECTVEEGYVVFYTNHFSLYAVVEKEEKEEKENELAETVSESITNDDTPDSEAPEVVESADAGKTDTNGAAFLWWLIPIAIVAAGVTILIVRRKLKASA